MIVPNSAARASQHGAAQLDDPGFDLGIGEAGIELPVQHGDDVGRGVFGRADAGKTAGLITRHEVCHRWNVRQHVQAGRGRDRQRAQAAGLDVLDRLRHRTENHLDLAADQVGGRGRAAPIGDVDQVHPGHHLEELAGNVLRGAGAGRPVVDLARVGLGIGDEFGDRLGGDRRMHHDDVGQPRGADNRRDVPNEVETEIAVERGIDRVRGHDLQQRVAIGGRSGDRLGPDVAAGAGAVLDDELLAEAIRQPLTHQPRLDVGGSAGGKADDDAHRPGRIGLRPRHAGHGR